MKLKFSETNIPFIELENGSKIIFSRNTETEKGFKFLVFSGIGRKSTKTRKKKGKTMVTAQPVSFVTTMALTGIPKEAKAAGLNPITISFLRKSLKSLCDDEGYFPRESLESLELLLEKVENSEEDKVDNDPTATESFDDVEEKPRKLKKKTALKIKLKPKKIKSKIKVK